MIKFSVGEVTLECETAADFFRIAPTIAEFRPFLIPVTTSTAPGFVASLPPLRKSEDADPLEAWTLTDHGRKLLAARLVLEEAIEELDEPTNDLAKEPTP
jgi:hypothetical protein